MGIYKKIICLETKEVFENAAQCIRIKKQQGLTGFSKVKDACNKSRRVAGGYHWCHLEELPENYTEEDIREKIREIDLLFNVDSNGVRMKKGKRTINLDTGEEFYSAMDAARAYRLGSDAVAACCRGDYNSAGGFRWAYVDDLSAEELEEARSKYKEQQ